MYRYTSLTASLSACLGIHVLHDASDAEGALRLKLLPGIVGPDVDEFEGDEHVECGQAAILEGGTAEPARTLVITTTQRRSGTDVVIVPQSATVSLGVGVVARVHSSLTRLSPLIRLHVCVCVCVSS